MNIIKKITLLILITTLYSVHIVKAQIKYPFAKKTDQIDDYFGTKVIDQYRWLEDDTSNETKKWVTEENKVTQNYLSSIPFRNKIKICLDSIWNYERYVWYFKRGNYYYYYKNNGLQNQSVLYRQLKLTDTSEIFIDPNTMSDDGTISIENIVFNNTAKYCVCLLSQSGSDWRTAHIINVETKKFLADTLNGIKLSEISWKGDQGFYYSGYTRWDTTINSKKNQCQKLYFHKIGTPQSEDQLIYGKKGDSDADIAIRGYLTEDERFLIVYETEGIKRSIWIKDMKRNSSFMALHIGGEVIDNDDDRLLIKTSTDAPNYKIVSVDPSNPLKNDWIEIVPEKFNRLENIGAGGGKLFLTYLVDGADKVYQYDYHGNEEREINLPSYGTAAGFNAARADTELFYSYTSFSCPRTIYHYSITTGENDLLKKPVISINTDSFETVITFFKSKDGTSIPMYLTYKKGLKLDGNNPTLIYAYGGFGISLTPVFNIATAFFINQGGVYVQVNTRGGDEYAGWHQAGMLQNKQNVFDDIFAAIKFLTDKKVTNSQKIALQGTSNGGLLVGACMTQHPELFKVAVPQAGLMDMLRYQLFTIGWRWIPEYGLSNYNKEDFKTLYKYSPLHNLKNGVTYPATFITTADHDDRVVPAHSYKFAARLQECNNGINPTLISVETKAGHGFGKPISKVIEEETNRLSFIMYNLGMEYKDL